MGNTPSSTFANNEIDYFWSNENRETAPNTDAVTFFQGDIQFDGDRQKHRRELTQNLNEFRQELARKHEKRRQLIAEKRKEMADLREEMERVKKENEELKKRANTVCCDCQNKSEDSPEDVETKFVELTKENVLLRSTMDEMKQELVKSLEIADKNKELRIGIAELQSQLQSLNSEVASFEEERRDYRNHVVALKDVIKVSKDLLKIREDQIQELTKKIDEIEKLLKEREAELLSDSLREEYEKQLENIRHLRNLYEERQRANSREKDVLKEQLEEAKRSLETELNSTKELQERVAELEEANSKKYDTITTLQSNLGLTKAESRELQAEMAVINQLFSQILLSFNNCQDVDLEKLTKILEENHDLLTEIVVNEESTEVSSALPKTLLDLVNQVADKQKRNVEEEVEASPECDGKDDDGQASAQYQLNSAEEIVENLPKVWKVLIELLSHQCPPTNVLLGDVKDSDNPCYKSIQTPNGTKLVVSVSNTFIRLKDLILEKKSLEKEMSRLKHLNGHLETRLQDQEKRLEMVSSELSKTWHVVGKMQRQHQQLHTQEKILRYELAQKRKLLTELKEELEYCREKWVQAREKNSSTEEQWKQLRTEFASRKNTMDCDSNNSVESGYSDEKSSSESDDQEEEETNRKEIVLNQEEINQEGEEVNRRDEGNRDDEVIPGDEVIQEDEISPEDELTQEVEEVIQEVRMPEEEPPPKEEGLILQVVKTEIEKILEEVPVQEVQATLLENDKTELVQKTEEKERQEEKTSPGGEDEAQCSSSSSTSRTSEEILSRREARLKRLEEQCQQLVNKVTNTTQRGVQICNKLENLHEIYGGETSSRNEENVQPEEDPPQTNEEE